VPELRARRPGQALGEGAPRQGRLGGDHRGAARRRDQLRGGAADEAPDAYKRLDTVLAAHTDAVRVLHELRPIGVAMAGGDMFDPYKD
jgi:tRNA-splicing ligase RtcB